MSYFIILFSFGYVLTLLCLAMPALTYRPLSLSRKNSNISYQTFSIIVVYRNEIHNLPQLLKSLKAQSYDLSAVELLFINDDSSDGSALLLQEFAKENPSLQIKCLDRIPEGNSAKKDGITQALHISQYNNILVTDADCILPLNWIAAYNNHYNKHADALLVAGPIKLSGRGLLSFLQKLEMIALQTLTAGAFAIRQPFMCNGANLSFRKDAFLEVNGYVGNDHLSSGDDVFLLEKLAAENVLQCHYLKDPNAIVITESKNSWEKMVHQRARWSRKGTETKSLLNKLVAFQVGMISLIFLINPFLWWFELISFEVLSSVYLLKFFTDFVVVVIGNQFFEEKNWGTYFLFNFFIYPLVVIAVGIKSLQKLEWHERTIDQNPSL